MSVVQPEVASVVQRDMATREECAEALRALSDKDYERLEKIARLRVIGLHAVEWRELLHDAIARLLDGRRQWPRNVPLVVFLRETMRSIASDHWRRLDGPVVVAESEWGTDGGAVASAADETAQPERPRLRRGDASADRGHVRGRRRGPARLAAMAEREVAEGDSAGARHRRDTVREHAAADTPAAAARVSLILGGERMSENRTPVERLDSLLAGLEDEVLTSEAEKNVSAERVATMRSETEALIRASVDHRAQEREPGRDAGAPTVRARATVARAVERLGSWAGAIAPGGGPGVSPRVRMAFSGDRPEKGRKSKGGDPRGGLRAG